MRKRRITLLVVGLVILVLVVLRLALPSLVERQVNAQLAEMGEYQGRVDRIGLALWRGAYTLHDLRIEKRDGDVPVPLLEAPRVAIGLSWRNLFRGAIVARVRFERPVIHFVDGRSDDDSLTGTGVDWRQRLEDLVPTRIDEVVIHDGVVVFHNFVSDPPVDLQASSVEANIVNLTNVRDAQGSRVAQIEVRANVFGSGRLESEAAFDPFGRLDEFAFAIRILEIDLTELNELARAYANLDFESGNGEFVMELEASDGQLTGYAKPLFQQLSIFSWRSDVVESDKNPLQIGWEALVEGLTSVFRNRPSDQFGTRFEISGRIDDPQVSMLSAIVGILRNAFGEALRPYFEGYYLPSRSDSDD